MMATEYSGYSWAEDSDEPWAKTWDDNINFINPPAGCYTKYSKQPDVPITSLDGTTLAGKLCPFGAGYIGWNLEQSIAGCEVLGTSCQGVMYRSKDAAGRPGCDATADNVRSPTAASQPCWQPYATIEQGRISDTSENVDTRCGQLCDRGGSPFVILKDPPSTITWTWALDSNQVWAKTWDDNINFINPPAGCYTKYSKQPDVPITSLDGTTLAGKLCPFGAGYIGWNLEQSIAGCEVLGTSCQGVMYRSKDAAGRPGCDATADNVRSPTAASHPCWQPYETFEQGKVEGGSKENTDIRCGQLCDRGGSPFVILKEGTAVPSPPAGLWCLASITKIPKVVNGNIEHVEIKDLKVGDIIQTTRGNMPISDIMNTDTRGYVHDNYVKVEKGALGENFPSEDLYVTHEHSFSLGYYKNSLLNRNIHDNDQDDMVYLHITADQLADKLPGVTRISKEFESAINLVFDEHTSINIYGLDVVTHHPKGNPLTLPEEKYQDKSKFNNKIQKPLFANYNMLVNAKPEHMEMKDFLRGCITADLNNKLNLEDVNNISFTPQKTMLTEDLRIKLTIN